MRRAFVAATLVGSFLAAGLAIAAPDDMPPAMDAKEWINSAPRTEARLAGRVLYVEVFRTW
jgi:hypothetical protein